MLRTANDGMRAQGVFFINDALSSVLQGGSVLAQKKIHLTPQLCAPPADPVE